MDIKTRILELRDQQEQINLEIEELQEQCTHPEYVEGLSMIACVQLVLICTTCGHGRSLFFEEDKRVLIVRRDEGGYHADATWLPGSPPVGCSKVSAEDAIDILKQTVLQSTFANMWSNDYELIIFKQNDALH